MTLLAVVVASDEDAVLFSLCAVVVLLSFCIVVVGVANVAVKC